MVKHIHHTNKNEQGYTLIGVMLIVALLCVSLAVGEKTWAIVVQREKERELEFNMISIQRGIDRYKLINGKYPETLEKIYDLKLVRKKYKNPFDVSYEKSWSYNQEIGEINPKLDKAAIDGSRINKWKVKYINNKYKLIKY